MTIRLSEIDLDIAMVPEFGAKELFFRLKNFIGENLSLVFLESELLPAGKVTGFGTNPGLYQYRALPNTKIVQVLGGFTLQGPADAAAGSPTIPPDTQRGAIPYSVGADYDHKVRTRVLDDSFLMFNYNTDTSRIALFNAIIFQVRNTRP